MRKLTPVFTIAALSLLAAPVAVQGHGPGGFKLFTDLSGEEEVGQTSFDEDGAGTFEGWLNAGQEELCFTLEVQDIASAVAAHVHRGAAGTNGPVVVVLEAPADGDSTGCVEVDRQLAQQIIRDPQGYYINVHNPEFPAGVLRGQLGD